MSWRQSHDHDDDRQQAGHSNELRLQLSGMLDGAGRTLSAGPSPSANSNRRSGPWTDAEKAQLVRLRNFYAVYEPVRVPTAEITLKTWRGSEPSMWRKLEARYGPFPTDMEIAIAQSRLDQQHADEQSRSPHGYGMRAAGNAVIAGRRLSPTRARAAAAASDDHAAAGGSGGGGGDYRARLQRFYAKVAPEKLPTVDRALEVFHGREETLFQSLVRKYGEEPPSDYPVPDAYGHDPHRQVTFAASPPEGAETGDRRHPLSSNNIMGILQADAEHADRGSSGRGGGGRRLGSDRGSSSAGSRPVVGKLDVESSESEEEVEEIDWEECCKCSSCSALLDAIDSRRLQCISRFFYPVLFVCAIIGAIVTALVLVGVDRNLAAFHQVKTTSELDTSVLYGPGVRAWGANARAVEFKTYYQEVTVKKQVACCGGQTLTISTTWYWNIANEQTGQVNRSGLAAMVREFGGIPEGNVRKVAEESLSNVIPAKFNDGTIDNLISNRTRLADDIHEALVRDLRTVNIWIEIPRSYFTLGYVSIPTASQKAAIWVNNETLKTAAFKEVATEYRQATRNNVSAIEANTSLILSQAQVSAQQLRAQAQAENEAKRYSNFVFSVAAMVQQVNAQDEAASIELMRINELLDVLEIEPQSQLYVNQGNSIFPLV